MDPIAAHLIEQAMVFAGVIIVVVSAAVVTLVRARAKRRNEVGDPSLAKRLDELAAQLSRLETAVDSSALEIERISEGQRFTTRLLAERSPATPGSSDSPSKGVPPR